MAVNKDEIKRANRIEDVIQEAGIVLRGSGRYMRSAEHSSFVVDLHHQSFHDNGAHYAGGKEGDLVDWVMHWKRTDFKGAMEFLARRAGLDEPIWSGEDAAVQLAARVREDALTVAARRFAHRLWRNEKALEYARGRGWQDETIKRAGLGFVGWNSEGELDELRKDFEREGIDLESPAAVAFLGFKGDLGAWAKKHKIEQVPVDWVTGKVQRINPAPKGMLVYPHVEAGRVRYVSFRAIEGKRHMNLLEALTGKRQPFLNAEYSPHGERVVVVEGQADAITLAQWGVAAVALAGVSAQKDLFERVRGLGAVYVGADQDEAGEGAAWKLGNALGPMTRMLSWPAKDANDALKEMIAEGVEAEEQVRRVEGLLAAAPTIAERWAERVGRLQGAERDRAIKDAFALFAQLSEDDLAIYRSRLSKAMGINQRDFLGMLKVAAPAKAEDEGDEEIQETVGGFIKGWLVELLYLPDEQRTRFAYRDPEGKVGEADQLEIEGVTYKPKEADSLIRQEQVVLPSGLGKRLSEKELVAKIVDLVHRHYLIDEFYEKLIAYYVMFTYAFDSFRNVVYLRMLGPAGAGKSQLMMIAGYVSRRLIFLSGADSEAVLFRALDLYKGTLLIDEADKSESDTDAPFVKILNVGYRFNGYVSRTRDAGGGEWLPEGFHVFGPKLLTTRLKFDDDGLESRCLSVEMIKYTTAQLKNRNIPITLETDFFDEAALLRNELLTWRMHTWQPDRRIDDELVDKQVDPRLNQVMTPIMQIISDPEVRLEMRDLVRRYHQRSITEKSMTLEAKVLQALVEIHDEAPITADKDGKPVEPYWDLSVGNVAMVANDIIDEENREPDADEDEDRSGKKLTNRGVGSIINNRLNLVTQRASGGPLKGKYLVQWDEERIQGLMVEYGLITGDME